MLSCLYGEPSVLNYDSIRRRHPEGEAYDLYLTLEIHSYVRIALFMINMMQHFSAAIFPEALY
jgi:hypothetical protein